MRDKDAATILAAFDWHHWPIPFADGGTCEPQNLTPMLRADHKRETATKTVPMLAKGKRLRKLEAKHRLVMDKKGGLEWTRLEDETIKALGLQKVKPPKRKMQSRPFQGSRKFNGQISWRTEKK